MLTESPTRYAIGGDCLPDECCMPCDVGEIATLVRQPYNAPPTRHLRFQQIMAGGWHFGFRLGSLTTDDPDPSTRYTDCTITMQPTRFGVASGASTRVEVCKPQPLPVRRRVMLFPMDSSPWNAYRIGRDAKICVTTGFNHDPNAQWFYDTFEFAALVPIAPFANGIATATPSPGAAAYFDGFYWLESPPPSLSGTAITLKGWSSLAGGGGVLDAPVETASAFTASYSSPATFQEWKDEVDYRLTQFSFPLAEGEDHNLCIERGDSGEFVTNRNQELFHQDVLQTCHWCIAENSDPYTYTFYQLQGDTALSPPNQYWTFPLEQSCRKAPWGPWWEMPCDQPVNSTQHPRFFAFHYVKTIKIPDVEESDVTGTYIDQPAARRDRTRYTREIDAVWKGKIRVTGFEAGEPYRYQFFAQDQSSPMVEEIRYAADVYVDVDPPEELGFVRILPVDVP